MSGQRSLIGAGYALALVWCAMTGTSAYSAFTTVYLPPASLADVHANSIPSKSASVALPAAKQPAEGDLPRDPFAPVVVTVATPPPTAQTAKGIAGWKVRAVVLSLRKGAVLEDSSGEIFFLRESESAAGLTVKGVAGDSVTVERDGQQWQLSVDGPG
ncbi:MAG: hypothetical protein HGA80_05645 [Candidatus Omnitrophica bacterium]|nr:hypothetical protein [Candidatus Omnitrophota bacterium]